MADGFLSAGYQARHIEINVGNVLTIGLLSLLWWGAATWTTNWLAGTTVPVVSQLAIGGQTFLHGA